MASGSVVTIDTHYVHPGRAAVYLLIDGDRAAFIDTSTARALPRLLSALDEHGLTPEQVEYAVVTHVHLDHGAGTGAVLRACPNATALVHPRGARHLIDPTRLTAAAKRVYGEEAFTKLHGEVEGIDAGRVRTVADGETVRLGERALTFLHTAGHAGHHVCIHDSGSNAAFTGDAFGVAYPAVQHGRKPYLLCSAPPTEFNAVAARETVRRVLATGAVRAYPTHFGPVEPLAEAAEELLQSIGDMEAVRAAAAESGLRGDALVAFCAEGVRDALVRQLVRCGIDAGPEEWKWLGADIHMNALGLAHVASAPAIRRAP